MTEERAMVAFKRKEKVKFFYKGEYMGEYPIKELVVGFKKARTLNSRIAGEDKKFTYSYVLSDTEHNCVYNVGAEQIEATMPDPPDEYIGPLIKSIVGCH